MKKTIILLFILIIVSLPSIFPLFHAGFLQTDDGEWMIIRFSAFHQVLRDGQFPVRFLSRLNYGYGYPVSNFLYPGFMYLAEPFKILGFGFLNAIKIIIGFSMLGSAIFTFLWLKKLFNNLSALLGSVVYLYYPYHLYDLYKRGSVGELLALAVLPFVLWQIERNNFFLISLGIAFLILSHNTLAVLFLPVLVFYMLIKILKSKEQSRALLQYIGILLFGFGLSAFFWIPAILELSITKFHQTQVSEWNRYFANIELIGLGAFILAASLPLFFIKKLKKTSIVLESYLFFFVGALSIFFSSSISSASWNSLPVTFIQFPFRFLSLTIICSSFLVATFLSITSDRLKNIASIIFLFVLLIISFPFTEVKRYVYFPDDYYATNEDTTTVKNEYMPRWVIQEPRTHFANKVEVLEGTENVRVTYTSNKLEIFPNTTQKKFLIHTIYYPGWIAYADGKEIKILIKQPQGTMIINVPEHTKKIEVIFKETSLRIFADFLSIISLCILFIKFLFDKKIITQKK